MKLIVRADDVGYSVIHNEGTFYSIDNGIVTTADVMLDTPGTVDALTRLRSYPWISVGWHIHDWGRPVTDPSLVPSLIDEDGWFKWTTKNSNTFVRGSKDVAGLQNSVNFDEILLEYRNQIERCIKILGRAPDTCGSIIGDSPVAKARKQVCDEYGIKYGWYTKGPGGHTPNGVPCLPQYEHLHIFMPTQLKGTNAFMTVRPASDVPERYNPMREMRRDSDHILDKEIAQIAFHPGFLDDYVMFDGGLDTIMTRIRVMDVEFLCSKQLRDWVKDNGVELVNQRDALYGLNEYQQHLRSVGSDLYFGK